MDIFGIINRAPLRPEDVEGHKIPWDEPGFSARMLANHLSQEHDWASRRSAIIDRQVDCIEACLPDAPALVLDLGCGPGLYTSRLARHGHHCVGVDFSPAAIAYAREQAALQNNEKHLEYILADIRQYRPERKFDAILVLFGELNVFNRQDAAAILKIAAEALKSEGKLFLEVHTFQEIKQQGLAAPNWQSFATGLFSAEPHLCLEENAWHEDSATAMTRYITIDAATAACREYLSGMCAYTDGGYVTLLEECGFGAINLLPVDQWPSGEQFSGKLQTYICSLAD